MKKKKMFAQAVAVLSATALSASPVLAAGWKKDTTGWWWQENNGGYPANKWQWLDGNDDGTAESYYFGSNGYMYANAKTPDGYQVNVDGQWTENGIVQTKLVRMSGNWKQGVGANAGRWYWEKGNGQMLGAGWHWLDGNNDGVFECYYIGQDGYMAANGKTPDGYDVNADGAWTVNGKIQIRGNVAGPGGGTGSTATASKGSSGGGGGGGSHSSGGGSSSGGSSSSDRDESVKYGANDPDTGNYGKMTDSERRAVANAIEKFKSDYDIDSKDDLQKELAILKWLIANCEYETGKEWSASTAYSCIIEGHAQCAGYADAFLQTAKACGLEVKYIYNDAHAWNLVKLDGQWYHVDATWEDAGQNNDVLHNRYINLDDAQVKAVREHGSWSPSSLKATGKVYNNGQIIEYVLATGTTDPEMKGDNYRVWLMDTPGQKLYNENNLLFYVGTKLDNGSNYFQTPDTMTEQLVNYLKSRFQNGKNAYVTFPAGTDVKWLTKTWLEDHVGGSGYNYVQGEANNDSSYRTVLIKAPSSYCSDEEVRAKLDKVLAENNKTAFTSLEQAIAYLTEQTKQQKTTVAIVYEGTDTSIMVGNDVKNVTGTKEIDSCKFADEKLSVNGKVYTIRTYQIAYTSLRDALGDYLESDNSNLFVDANGTNYNGNTFEEAYTDKIVNKHGRAAFEIVRKGIEIDFTDKFQAILDANGIKLNDSIQRTKDTDTIEYAGETYYVDKYSYTRLSGKDDIKDTLPEVYKDAPVIDFTNMDDTAKAIYEYTKGVFLQARASQASRETVSAYYIVNLSDDVEDDTDDLMAKLKKLLRADTEFYDSEYVITYPSMRNKTVYDGGALYACEATQTCNKQTAAQNLYVEDSADIVEDKETIGVAAKIPSNENILDEDAEKEKVKEKAEEKNVGVLKLQDPDNDIAENAEEENTEEENATGVKLKEDAEPEANEEVTGAKAEAFDVTEDK